MPIKDIYAKIVRGIVCPVDEWILVKLLPPESVIFDRLAVQRTNMVQLCAVSLSNACDDLKIGQKYIIAGWEQEINQMQFAGDDSYYAFMKPKYLIAEYHD
jgi:hypothetical protein